MPVIASTNSNTIRDGTARRGAVCHRSGYAILQWRFLVKVHMLTLNSIIQRNSEVLVAEAAQDLIMVNIASGYYYGLSDVARKIWEAIERPKRVSNLIDDLTANYNVSSSLCEEQTLAFLNALLDEGLLQVEDGSAG